MMKPCIEAIKSGVCDARCCRSVPVPFLTQIYTALKSMRIVMPDEEVIIQDVVYPYRDDMRCVFLRDEGQCNIYEIRPQICIRYGDGVPCYYYDGNDNPNTRARRKELLRDDKAKRSKQHFLNLKRILSSSNGGGIYLESYSRAVAFATPEILLKEYMDIRGTHGSK